jgi:gamma-glutamyltranspeptidase/glutathione hydrolase
MPPVSSGGTLVIEMLNILEGFDLGASGFGAASTVHRVAEAMRRAYADRARHLGDPEFNPRMPLRRLLSKEYAAELRATMKAERASVSAPDRFEWPRESPQTTHVSAVDAARNAVSLTYTLEDSYGAKIVVPGAGFLLNNEMGDFNAGPGLTDAQGLIGTEPNLAAPGKRMLSSMAPTILARDGKVFLTLGSPGGRRIPNAVLLTILNVVDFGMNVQEAVDALRYHHQWLPDRILHEPRAFSPDTAQLLRARGHELDDGWSKDSSTWVGAVLLNASEDLLEGGCDRRSADAAAAGH